MTSGTQRLVLIIEGKAEGAKKALAEVSSGLSTTTKVAGAVGAGMLAVGVVVGKALGGATKAAASYGSEVVQIQRLTGASAEESSKWAAILGRYNVTGKAAGMVVKSLNNAIAGNSAELKAVGVATQNANGSYRTSFEVLGDLAEAYKNADDKTLVLKAATASLGRGYATLLPVLAGGRDLLTELGDAAEHSGLVMSDKQLAAVKDYNRALKDNEDAVKGATVQVGLATLPWETFKTKAVGELIGKLNELNPKLVETGVGIADVGADIAKYGGYGLGAAVGLKYIGAGALLGKAGAGLLSFWETVKIAGLYAAEGIGTATTAAGGLATGVVGAGVGLAYFEDKAAKASMTSEQYADRMKTAYDRAMDLSKATGTVTTLHQGIVRTGEALPPLDAGQKLTASSAQRLGLMAIFAADGLEEERGQARLTHGELNGARGANLNAAQAVLDYRDAHRGLVAAKKAILELEKHGKKGTGEYRTAVDELTRAEIDNGRAEMNLNTAKGTLTRTIAKLRSEGKSESEILKALGDDGAAAATKFGLLKTSMDKVPGSKTVKVDAQTAKAQTNIGRVNAGIAGIEGKTVTVSVRTPGLANLQELGRTMRSISARLGITVTGKVPKDHAEGGVFTTATAGVFGEASPRFGEYLVNADKLAAGDTRQRELALSLVQHMPSADRSMPSAARAVPSVNIEHLTVAEGARFVVSSDLDVRRIADELGEMTYVALRAKGIV